MNIIRRSFVLLTIFLLAACSGPGPAPTPANLQTIKFAYAAAAQAWIAPMIDAFNKSATMTTDGKQIAVVGTPLSAGDMVSGMVGPNPPYTMLIPEDQVWVDILNDTRKQHGDPGLNIGACTPLAHTPLVMITWQSMADTLGWPERDFTWHDIADLALSPSAWQGYDHPEWGTLTFGHAHPLLSNGGLEATLGEAYAAGPLTAADVSSDSTKSYVRVVERSISRYGTDTSVMIAAMAQKGQKYLHVALGYESDVIQNHGGSDPLVAIYPTETFMANFSACVINADPATTQFAQYLAGADAQRAAITAGFRPADPTAVLTAPFDAGHGVDPTAKFKTLPMPSAQIIQTVQDVWGQLKRPLNVTLVIDVSGSMKDQGKIEGVRDAAAAFVNRLGDNDQLSLYSFSDNYLLLVNNVQVGTQRSQIISTISGLQPNGGTLLYNSVWEARQRFKVSSQYINALIVLTDGQDNASTLTIDDLVKNLQGAKGAVFTYTIGYGSDADDKVLSRIADAGNGTYYHSDPTTINQVYLDIASQFGGSRGLGR